MPEVLQTCATCARAAPRKDGGYMCGASADEDENGLRPIWAERKYSGPGLLAMLDNGGMLPGMDCGNMSFMDGQDCKLHKSYDSLTDAEAQQIEKVLRPEPVDPCVAFTLRLPPYLSRQLDELAARGEVSKNSLILRLLEEAADAETEEFYPE